MRRLAVVCDFVEEQWPSMDLVAEMLCAHLRSVEWEVNAVRICPPFIRRLGRLPLAIAKRAEFNADRLVNRWIDYPRHLRQHLDEFDYFHICDHSYAHLVHVLPPERTGVYCHDLDCFRCLLEPQREPRPRWFRALSRRILSGLQKASVVFYSTAEIRRRLVKNHLVDPTRLIHAPYGISPEFTPAQNEMDTRIARIVGKGAPFLLHVGSCIPRKRLDVLLDVFAAVRVLFPDLILVQVGAEWPAARRNQIDRLGIEQAIHQMRGLSRRTLAALYRQAQIVLQPSEAEGFGLPVIEALACGAPVVASDIPVLREVGGTGAMFCPVADIPSWVETVVQLLVDPTTAPTPIARQTQAARFCWDRHAQTILQGYTCQARMAA
jgi:glycosyltransferase involved in cell wall biosynthesis